MAPTVTVVEGSGVGQEGVEGMDGMNLRGDEARARAFL